MVYPLIAQHIVHSGVRIAQIYGPLAMETLKNLARQQNDPAMIGVWAERLPPELKKNIEDIAEAVKDGMSVEEAIAKHAPPGIGPPENYIPPDVEVPIPEPDRPSVPLSWEQPPQNQQQPPPLGEGPVGGRCLADLERDIKLRAIYSPAAGFQAPAKLNDLELMDPDRENSLPELELMVGPEKEEPAYCDALPTEALGDETMETLRAENCASNPGHIPGPMRR